MSAPDNDGTVAFNAADSELLASKEFSALLAADQELKRLDSLKYDKALESRTLMEVLKIGDLRIGKLPVRPVNCAKWAFLWMLDSPFVGGGEINDIDLDIALYVLSCEDIRLIPVAIHEIPVAALGYHKATGLAITDVLSEVRSLVNGATRPMLMLPPPEKSDEPNHFDGIWSISMAGLAARESNHTFEYCLYEMSLSAVCGFYVDYCRRNGTSGLVRHRNADDVSRQINHRISILAAKFIKKTRENL